MSVDPKTNLQPSIDKLRRVKELNNINSLNSSVATKQEKLVSTINIKKLNGEDLIGTGNLTLEQIGAEARLTEGANINIDRTDPDNPVISTTGVTSSDDYTKSFLLGGM
jgi:hypothetical protein